MLEALPSETRRLLHVYNACSSFPCAMKECEARSAKEKKKTQFSLFFFFVYAMAFNIGHRQHRSSRNASICARYEPLTGRLRAGKERERYIIDAARSFLASRTAHLGRQMHRASALGHNGGLDGNASVQLSCPNAAYCSCRCGAITPLSRGLRS